MKWKLSGQKVVWRGGSLSSSWSIFHKGLYICFIIIGFSFWIIFSTWFRLLVQNMDSQINKSTTVCEFCSLCRDARVLGLLASGLTRFHCTHKSRSLTAKVKLTQRSSDLEVWYIVQLLPCFLSFLLTNCSHSLDTLSYLMAVLFQPWTFSILLSLA